MLDFRKSDSDAEAHEVDRLPTTTTITGDDPDPSLTGDSVTVTYTVTVDDPGSGTPTGQVTVSDGTGSCTGSVAAGRCSLVLTGAGIHQLVASYAGDPDSRRSDSDAEAHEVTAPSEPPAVVYLQPDLLLRTARPASPSWVAASSSRGPRSRPSRSTCPRAPGATSCCASSTRAT